MTVYALTDLSCPRCGVPGKLKYNADQYVIPIYRCKNSSCGLVSPVANVKSYNGLGDDDVIASVTLDVTAESAAASLAWSFNNIDPDSVVILRNTENDLDNATQLATSDSDVFTYSDDTVETGTTYYYWISVTNADSDSYHSLGETVSF